MQFSHHIILVVLACSGANGSGPEGKAQDSGSAVPSARRPKIQPASPTNYATLAKTIQHTNLTKSNLVTTVKLDINQKVYIEGQPVLGDGVGQGALNKCRGFAPQHVTSPDKPSVKVCGTGIKMTAYLMGKCKSYYQHSRTIGKCQSTMPPQTCDSFSPALDKTFGAYQSYKIEPC